MPNNQPCLNCEKRQPLCHADCEAYRAMKEAREAGREAARKAVESKHFLIDNARKAQKRANRK